MMRRRTAAVALIGMIALSGCWNGAPQAAPVSVPTAIPSPPPGSGSGDPVTKVPVAEQTPVAFVEPTPSLASSPAADEKPVLPKTTPRNESGGVWTLDEAGSRACSFAEFAFRAPEVGTDPAKSLNSLREVIGQSETSALVQAVKALPAKPSTEELGSVLKVCSGLGYQL